MATLTPADFERIEADAAHLTTKGHTGALEVVLRIVRSLQQRDFADPALDTLQVLAGMWGRSPFHTPATKQGLDDIGAWLEARLGQRIDAAHLLLEASWLKRAIVGIGTHEYDGPGPHARRFGSATRLQALRKQRTPAAVPPPAPPHPVKADPKPKHTPPPEAPALELPLTTGARFKDFNAFNSARDANKRLKDDLKKGKPATDRRIAVVVDHPALQGHAFTISPTTSGWHELFARIDKAGGRQLSFRVTVTRLDPPTIEAISE